MASALHLEPPQRLVRALGADHPWLTGVPALADRMLERWELTPDRVVTPGGRGSVVILVRCSDGTPAALKLCAFGAAEETAALERWDGLGTVRLLRRDTAAGALLLERLHGQMSLRSLPEAKATLEAVSAVRRLWVPVPAAVPVNGLPFETVAGHTAVAAEELLPAAPAEVRPLVDEALGLRAGLLADAPDGVLLHGDFRQGAVLASDAERSPWLTVGPEPLVGEPAFDLARLARDRLHDLVAAPSAATTARRRVGRLADSLDIDRDRLRGWTLYRAVESGVRCLSAGHRQDGEALLEFAGWL